MYREAIVHMIPSWVIIASPPLGSGEWSETSMLHDEPPNWEGRDLNLGLYLPWNHEPSGS